MVKLSSRNNNKHLIFLIVLLIAFGLGSGIGISMGITGFDTNDTEEINDTPILVNVTNNISNYESRNDTSYDIIEDELIFNNSSGIKYYPSEEFNNISKSQDDYEY